MDIQREAQRYLEFSCGKLELQVNAGEKIEGSFFIHTSDKAVMGVIYSTDTRMQLSAEQFTGENCQICYTFGANYLEIGANVQGNFVVLSNVGEYTLPFTVVVKRPMVESSLGDIKDLFQFTNLAKTNWQEAVAAFYAEEFVHIFDKREKEYLPLYLGLSKSFGNENNVEEFLQAIKKKTPIQYETDIDGFYFEEVLDSITKTVVISKKGWGYTHFDIWVEGNFLGTNVDVITQDDFEEDHFTLEVQIDASKLHVGTNQGWVHLFHPCKKIDIPVSIVIRPREQEEEQTRHLMTRLVLQLMDDYAEMKMGKLSRDLWIAKAKDGVNQLLEEDEDNLAGQLFSVQVLLEQERFNEAKWYLDQIGNRLRKEEPEDYIKCYYYYLTTLYNRDEMYLHSIKDALNQASNRNPEDWRIALLFMNLEEEYNKNPEAKWRFLEEQFHLGCASPALLCEGVELLQTNPSFLLRLEGFEQQVLWFAAKYEAMTDKLIEHVLYLAGRVNSFSPLLYRVFTAIYEKKKSDEALLAVCRLLILGDKRGKEYFDWYQLGIQRDLRIPKLYEYYMYTLDREIPQDIPKIVLMYFVYQSNLDYERTAYLYAYVMKNRSRYPELEAQYRMLTERFLMDQIKAGHINKDLAYLYQNALVPQMLRDELAYAFTPLLFMHQIFVDNRDMISVVVVHNKVKGESNYPISDGICMIPIYGTEYQIFLQDKWGNRYTKSVPYMNEQLMDYEQMVPFISASMEGRLSFDIYQCEAEKNYITISDTNVKRYKKLVESEQVIDSFKQEIRTKLLHFYYENDRIGELDAFLEETEAYHMEEKERAEFIKFLISRGMFDKAYYWVKQYGMAGVNPKTVARLISKRIVSQDYLEDDFLVNVAFYIFKNSRYDENILKYLILHYQGTIRELRNIWKAARDLELDTKPLMERMLKQMLFTGSVVPEKVQIVLDYETTENHDHELVDKYFEIIAKDYFTKAVVVEEEFFRELYQRYRKSGNLTPVEKLTLLHNWAQNQDEKVKIPRETIIGFVEEFLQKDIYFAFYTTLADMVPQLHYLKNKVFIEYHTIPGNRVKLHYHFDKNVEEETVIYRVEEMQEMADGIFVKAFDLFHGEVLQYYIIDEIDGKEELTRSDILQGTAEPSKRDDRFGKLNDIMISLEMQDDVTCDMMLEEYLWQDFYTRELFRVIS